MTRVLESPNKDGTIVNTLKLSEGGTGVTTLNAVKQMLQGIGVDQIDRSGGVASLKDNYDTLPFDKLSCISIQGPSSVVRGEVVDYVITNFDDFTVYNVQAIEGSVELNDEIIRYYAPNIEVFGGFRVNGRSYKVEIVSPKPARPRVLAPSQGFQGVNASITFTTSNFSMVGSNATHLSTSWELSTSQDFSTSFNQSLNDATNKTSWNVSNLPVNTNFYLRLKYKASDGSESNYSEVLNFKTKVSFLPVNEEAVVFINVIPAQASMFSNQDFTTVQSGGGIIKRNNGLWSYANPINGVITRNNEILAVKPWSIDLEFGGQPGNVHVEQAELLLYTQDNQVLVSGISFSHPNPSYGQSNSYGPYHLAKCKISGLGQRVISQSSRENTAPGFGNGNENPYTYRGAVYIHRRNGSSWVEEQRFAPAGTGRYDSENPKGNEFYQNKIAISDDESRIAIVGRYNSIYIFVRNNTTWTLEQTIGPPFTINAQTSLASNQIIFDYTGTRLFVSSSSGSDPEEMIVSIFRRSGSAWSHETNLTRLTVSQSTGNTSFGVDISVNDDGNILAIGGTGSPLNDNSLTPGEVYLFTRVGTTWTYQTTVRASYNVNLNRFGLCLKLSADGMKLAVGGQIDPLKIPSGYGSSLATYPNSIYVFS